MRLLKQAWGAWKKLGEKISIVTNTIVLTIVYFAAMTPIAIARKLSRKKTQEKTYWKDFNQEDAPEQLRRQF